MRQVTGLRYCQGLLLPPISACNPVRSPPRARLCGFSAEYRTVFCWIKNCCTWGSGRLDPQGRKLLASADQFHIVHMGNIKNRVQKSLNDLACCKTWHFHYCRCFETLLSKPGIAPALSPAEDGMKVSMVLIPWYTLTWRKREKKQK